MAKIIQIYENTVSIGMDDGTFEEFDKGCLAFLPRVGDGVTVYRASGRAIIAKDNAAPQEPAQRASDAAKNTSGESAGSMVCPVCGSHNVTVQTFQEHSGTTSFERSKTKTREKGHGCAWWLFIGWWWWIIDLCFWVYAFPIRLIIQLFKKEKKVSSSSSIGQTVNEVKYKTVCTCHDCGNTWKAGELLNGAASVARDARSVLSGLFK